MIEKNYLHSINLIDELVCNNISLPMAISSVMSLNNFALAHPVPTPLYNCNIQNLYYNPTACFAGIGSPCFRAVHFASFFRQNQPLINGFGQPMEFSDEHKAQVIFKANLEIEFERVRRQHFPLRPSRLSSVFAVDDDIDGRICLRSMFNDGVKARRYVPLILNVKIAVLFSFNEVELIHQGDTQWLNEYAITNNSACIHSYWKGESFNQLPLFEYLLEGTLVPTNKSQIEQVRHEGKFFKDYDYKKHWLDLDSEQFVTWFVDNN